MLRNLSTGIEASATGESLNSGDVAVHPAARHNTYIPLHGISIYYKPSADAPSVLHVEHEILASTSCIHNRFRVQLTASPVRIITLRPTRMPTSNVINPPSVRFLESRHHYYSYIVLHYYEYLQYPTVLRTLIL